MLYAYTTVHIQQACRQIRIAESSTSLACRYGAAVVQRMFHGMVTCDNVLGITPILWLDVGDKA